LLVATMVGGETKSFVFLNLVALRVFNRLLVCLYMQERKKKSEKEKKRESFETCSKIHHSPFGFVLPNSSNPSTIG